MSDFQKLTYHDFDHVGSRLVANAGHLRVEIDQDSFAENPWESWDFQTPIMVYSDRNLQIWDSGDDIENVFARFSDYQVSRHWREICRILDVSESDHESETADLKSWAPGWSKADCRREHFSETLRDLPDSDRLDSLAALYGLIGIPAICVARNGYCQRDWLNILLVATPEHANRCGFDLKNPQHDIRQSLEADADLFAAWAFGDVFGYSIECEETGETLDSCCGFYGALYDNEYLFSEINDAIERALEESKRNRETTVKRLVKNRVPLAKRAEILSNLSA